VAKDDHLERVELTGGESIPRDVLFAHPRQRQVDLVRSLQLALDDAGYVRVDEMNRETSLPGVHAGGDLVTPVQAAVLAAASAVHAAAAINRALAME
jgi:thioredoxin reductase